MNQEEILGGLSDMFQFVKPDASYLVTDEDASLDVTHVELLIANPETSTGEKIQALHHFNTEWFPDELDEEEQEEYQALLDAAAPYFPKK